MIYRVLGSSSSGNSVIYHNKIMVDCGVPFNKVEEYLNELELILLTHKHLDHINIGTLRKILFERPMIKLGIPKHLTHMMTDNNITRFSILEHGKVYKFNDLIISPIALYHNVPNYGYRIFKGKHKIIHATDTVSLEGISAKDYDLYAIEHNFDADTIQEVIDNKLENGTYSYEIAAVQNHLSFQKAEDFIKRMKKGDSEVLKLHISSRYDERVDEDVET